MYALIQPVRHHEKVRYHVNSIDEQLVRQGAVRPSMILRGPVLVQTLQGDVSWCRSLRLVPGKSREARAIHCMAVVSAISKDSAD